MNFVGFDPGKTGAMACVGDYEAAMKMPITGNDIDCRVIKDFLGFYSPKLIVIEKVSARPGQGVVSMFSFGKSYGTLIGIVDALGLPYILVTPQTWKKTVLVGTKKDKNDAIDFVRRRYPDIPLIPPRGTKPHDGIADATCMAHFARLQEKNPIS